MKVVIQACRPRILPVTLHFLDKLWPEHPEIVVISWAPHKFKVKVPVVFLPRDENFGSNMMTFLTQSYREKYFVNWLDDYILRHPVDHKLFQAAVQLVRRADVGCVRLRKRFTPQEGPFFEGDERFRVLQRQQRYLFSQQVSVWQTATYQRLLKRGETAWQTELRGSVRAKRLGQTLLGVAVECVDYHNLYKHGRIDRGSLRFVRKAFPNFLKETR